MSSRVQRISPVALLHNARFRSAHVQLGLLQKHALQHGATKWVKMLQKRRIHICHISAFHFNGTNDEHHLPSIYILWIYRYLPNLLVLVILAHFICQAAPRVADWSCDCILLATWQRTIQRRITSEISKALKDSKSVKLGGPITARKTASWSAPPRWSLLLVVLVSFWACGRNIFCRCYLFNERHSQLLKFQD